MFNRFTKFRSKISGSSGFSLIELMIALFIFALGMLAVTAMCLTSISGNSQVNRITQANYLAQNRMEELLGERNMAALDAIDGSTVNIDGVGAAGFNYVRTVDIDSDAGDPDVRWITVNVSWTTSTGTRQFELKSLARAL